MECSVTFLLVIEPSIVSTSMSRVSGVGKSYSADSCTQLSGRDTFIRVVSWVFRGSYGSVRLSVMSRTFTVWIEVFSIGTTVVLCCAETANPGLTPFGAQVSYFFATKVIRYARFGRVYN